MFGPIAIAIIVTLVISIPVTAFIATDHCKKEFEGKIGSAEDKAREIIDEALKTAEAKKREGLLEVKEDSAPSAGCSRKKRTSTRKPMRSRKKKANWQNGKRRCASSVKKYPN